MIGPRFVAIPLILALSVFADNAAKVSYLVGKVDVHRAGKTIPVRVSMDCQVGDTLVSTTASRLELRYPDNTLLRLDENTRMVLTNRVAGKPEPTLLGGKTWANVKKIGQGGTGFGVRTPTAVAAVRGTVFGVSSSDSASSVKLYEGKVDVGSQKTDSIARSKSRNEVAGPKEVSLEDWVRLLRGEEVTFKRDGTWSRAKFDPTSDLQDPWVKFNADRDAAAGRSYAAADSSATKSDKTPKDPDDPWGK
jgi:hypothetical protein